MTTTNELFAALDAQNRAKASAYWGLVRQLVGGAKPSTEQVISILAAAGVTADTLAYDVAELQRRFRLAAVAAKVNPIRNNLDKHDSETEAAIAAAQKRIAEAEKQLADARTELQQVITAADERRAEIVNELREAEAAKTELIKSDPDANSGVQRAELRTELAEARQVAHEANEALARQRVHLRELEVSRRRVVQDLADRQRQTDPADALRGVNEEALTINLASHDQRIGDGMQRIGEIEVRLGPANQRVAELESELTKVE